LYFGEHALDMSSEFTGSSLTFGVTGEGVSFDPDTGRLTILTDSLLNGVTVTVTAANSGGTSEHRFIVSVAEAPVASVAPALITPPTLSGEGRVGLAVSLDPGTWSGTPAPALAYHWLSDGMEITGATGTDYVPVEADAGHSLACRVAATNAAGMAEAVTEPLLLAHVPPGTTGGLPDLTLKVGEVAPPVETATVFTGLELAYSVDGAGASIDPATGTATIPTDAPLSETLVTATATNSGGRASVSFRVSIEAAEPEVSSEIGPLNAELMVGKDLDPEQAGLHLGLRITESRHPLYPSQGGIGHVAWTGGDPTGRDPALRGNKAIQAIGFADPSSPGYAVWVLSRRADGLVVSWADRSNEIGATFNITVAWSPDDPAKKQAAEASWMPWGPTLPPFVVALPEAVPPQPQAADWRLEQTSVQIDNGVQA
jgi:hypothetical protein